MIIFLKKTLRAMLRNKTAYLSCICLIAVGVSIYISFASSDISLSTAVERYYREYRLADVFAKVSAIPHSANEDLKRVTGIEDSMLRSVYTGRVIFPGNDKIISLRLISYSKEEESKLNSFILYGNDFADDKDIAVGLDFLKAHNLSLNQPITMVVEGKLIDFNICAGVESPEYIYAVKDATELLPDPSSFNIAFIQESSLFALTGQSGLYNDISLSLAPGYTFNDVKAPLEDQLKKYGLIELIDKKDQISYTMLDTELTSVKSMTTALPPVFIAIAAAVLFLTLKRAIEQERVQMGTLKAFGYTNTQIFLHYLTYGLATAFFGWLLGVVMGYLMTGSLIDLYLEYFKLPFVNKNIPSNVFIQGLGVSLFFGGLGAFAGAAGVLSLTPAQAMRASSPKAFKETALLKNSFVKKLLSPISSMAVRSIFRNKLRSAMITGGITLSFGIMALMGSYDTMMDTMLLDQFNRIQLYDAKLTLKTPEDYISSLNAVSHINGVTDFEAIFEVPAILKSKHRKTGVLIKGLDKSSRLLKIYDNVKDANLIPSSEGLTLSRGLADKLEAKRGDLIYLSSAYSDKDIKVIISEIAEQNLGLSCYMEIDGLRKLLDTEKTATAIILKTNDLPYLKEHLLEAKNISQIDDAASTKKNYVDMFGSYSSLIYVIQLFACVVAFAVIYNISSIAFSERKKQYATLRVLGLQVGQFSQIIAVEQLVLCFLGIAIGFPFTELLKSAMASLIETDLFSFNSYTPPSAYLSAALGCLLSIIFSNLMSARAIKRLDMVEALKERE